jgi:2-polyprenyl-6-hydroxyphenyl methylase/3-demethylubiquinone-9 3-methyltransferase
MQTAEIDASRTPRERNDPRQYDDLVDAWWEPHGPFAMLHALAAVRGRAVPAATREGAVLVDLGCGGGLLAPFIREKGYRHIGVDLTLSALRAALPHGVVSLQADVGALPLPNASADVVVLGEILEHVADHASVVAEGCRILRPGGTLVLDTIADTRLARLLAVEVAERLPGGAPKGIHDPALFVNRRTLLGMCADHGVPLRLRGLRPTIGSVASAWSRGGPTVRVVPTRSTAVLFQGIGVKRP